MLEDVGEGYQFPAAGIEPVADAPLHEVVGRCDVVERTVALSLLGVEAQEVEAVVDREFAPHVVEVDGEEAALRLLECQFDLAGLQHLVGMAGREAQGLASIDDVLAQPEGKVDDPLLGTLVADGVVVERPCHARKRGIVAVAILPAGDLLDDDCHLLLVDDV